MKEAPGSLWFPVMARRIPSSLEAYPSGSRALLCAVSGGRGPPGPRIP